MDLANDHHSWMDFPSGSDSKASACNAGNLGSIPGSGRSPGEGNGNPLQYSCLKNPIERRPGRLQSVGCKELDMTEWLHLSWMVSENTHPLSEFLLLFPFSLPWRGTEKEMLRQSIITLAFSAASSTSPFYHLFYNWRRLFTFRLFHSLNSISWVFYPTMNFSTPRRIFLQLSTQTFHATSNSMQDVFPA